MTAHQPTLLRSVCSVTEKPVLSVRNLKIHFPTPVRGETVKAVDDVSFAVRRGETFGIIGESGSGKSTLGRALVCLTTPTAGQVFHRGLDPFVLSRRDQRQHRRAYQIIFQDPNAALNPRMTIGASIREPMDIAGIGGSRGDRDKTVLTLLDRVGLRAEFAQRYPHELSGGQKQRVNIARALTTRPDVIVCDEVTAALDVSIQADILNLFADLQAEFGLTYVFITHDLGVVTHVSDRIAVMYLGRLMEVAPAEALAEMPLHPYTRALLSAEPVPLPGTHRRNGRIKLQGEIPSPIHPPAGCRFCTRCPQAEARCHTEEPSLRDVRAGHLVACHFVQG